MWNFTKYCAVIIVVALLWQLTSLENRKLHRSLLMYGCIHIYQPYSISCTEKHMGTVWMAQIRFTKYFCKNNWFSFSINLLVYLYESDMFWCCGCVSVAERFYYDWLKEYAYNTERQLYSTHRQYWINENCVRTRVVAVNFQITIFC